jgi:hypothetical protein
MCQMKNSPIKSKYQNHLFGNHVDHCLVGVISYLNDDKELATVASCCGHGSKTSVPYITVLQPLSRIDEIKSYLEQSLGWKGLAVRVFNDFPDDAWDQLQSFMPGKVYVGYYAEEGRPDILDIW